MYANVNSSQLEQCIVKIDLVLPVLDGRGLIRVKEGKCEGHYCVRDHEAQTKISCTSIFLFCDNNSMRILFFNNIYTGLYCISIITICRVTIEDNIFHTIHNLLLWGRKNIKSILPIWNRREGNSNPGCNLMVTLPKIQATLLFWHVTFPYSFSQGLKKS